MLADWYLCATQGLSMPGTDVYLDALHALDEPAERVQLAEEAINQLRRVEPGLMLYALPRVLASYRRNAGRLSFAGRAAAYLAELDELAGGHPDLRAAFDALADSPRRLRSRIAALAEAIAADTTEAETAEPEDRAGVPEPYDDLFSAPLATAAVALAAELAARSPETAREWLGDGEPELLADALAGRFGRLPFLLAVRFSALTDPSAGNRQRLLARLWAYGRGAADLEPDLVQEAAGLSRPEPFDVPSTLTEAVVGLDLAAWRRNEPGVDLARRDAVQARWGGRDQRSARETAAVLWQVALWRVAAERDPAATVAGLRLWWAAPTLVERSRKTAEMAVPVTAPFGSEHGAALSNLRTLAGLRCWDHRRQAPPIQLTDGPVTATPAASASLVGSPWLLRGLQRWRASAERAAYPEWNDPPSLIRLCAAAALAADLLDAVPPGAEEDAEHLLALLILTRDTAVCSPLRDAIDAHATVGGQAPAAALVSLYNHTLMVTDRCGKGHGPHEIPRRIVRLLTDGPASRAACDSAPTQWARLMIFAGPMAAFWWLRETVSGGWAEDDENDDGWLTGVAPTPAARLLRLLLAERLDFDSGQRAAPALLERDLRPSGQHAAGWGWQPQQEPDWDWLANADTYGLTPAGSDPAGRSRTRHLNANVLLLSSPHDLDAWRWWSTRLVKALGDEPAPMALQTVRLEALLHSPINAEGFDDWVEGWAKSIMRRVEPRELARIIRRRMVDLLHAPIVDPKSEVRVTHVGELVIDTILDLSRAAQWYHQLLLRALTTAGAPPSVATQWRYRAIGTLYRLGGAAAARSAISPYEVVGQRASAGLTADDVRALLFQHGGAPIVGQAASLGDAVEVLWRDLRTGPPVTRLETALSEIDQPGARGETARDDLTTLAVQLDRYRGTLVTYQDSRGGRLNDAFTARDRWAAAVSRLLDGEDGYGIVCAVDPQKRKAWVNAGFGHAAEHEVAAGDPLPELGDLVVAHFTGTRTEPRVDRAIAALGRPLLTAEARAATVRPLAEAPWLAVDIGGTDVYPGLDGSDENDTAARWRWDPDLARRHTDGATEGVETCARWDDVIERWVPVDRGGRELIAGERAGFAAGLRLVLAGQVTGDEQTRLRFVTRPGRSYLLGSDDFAPDDWARLLLLVADGRPGLAVEVRPTDPDGRLVLAGDVDERNRDWLRIFDEQDDGDVRVHVAVRTGNGWRVAVEPPAGFPAEVAVTSLDGSAANALCVVQEWGEPQARAAAVAAEPLEDRGVPQPEAASEERWQALFHLPRDARTRLRAVAGNPRHGSLQGYTEDGLPMRLPTESVSLAADPAVISKLGRQREVIIEVDRVAEPAPVRSPIAVSVEQLLGLSGSADLAAVLAGAHALDGLVVQKVRDGAQRTVHYGLWLRNGMRVSHAVVPEPTFSAAAEVGDHIDFRRVDAGWVAHVRKRLIRGQALYTGGAKAGGGWLPVGEVERDGRPYTVFQAPDRPIVATEKGADRPAGRHTVTRISRESWTYNGRSYVRVLVERGNRTYVGEALEFPHGSLMRVRGTVLRLDQHAGDKYPRYTVRRTFGLEAVIKQPPRPDASAEIELKRWERALRDGNQHMVGSRDGERLVLPGYRAPLPDGSLAGWLPLRADELPLVDGQAYDNGSVRVLVEDVDGGHVVSFARAVPLDVPGFAAALSLHADDVRAELPDPLYYVGAEPGHHRFEWGYGWTVDVPEEALTIDGEPAGPGLIFHGDRVRAVRLARDPAVPGGLVVDLAARDVAAAVSGQLMRESAAGMIHRVEVEIDLVGGRVAVLGVHTQRQRGTNDRIEVVAHPIRAELTPADAEAVVARERRAGRSGTVTRQLHGRLDTSAAAGQGRRKMFTLVDPARLQEGDLLYARADRIVDTGNELCLELRPLGAAGKKWIFSVARRQFSPQVGLLARQLRSPEGAGAYRGRQVMVRLLRKAPNRADRWHGSVVDTPARPAATLASWVRHQGAACFGVLGRDSRLEVGPGVFYDASGVPGASRLEPGTLVRLLASGPGTPLKMEVAIPADLRYVRDGRPALALPKNSLLNPGGLAQARHGNPFTLADLPAVEARTDRGMDVRALLRTPHPKVVYAVSRAPEDHARLRSIDQRVVAGTLALDTAEPARLHPVGGGPVREVDWAQLSFAEAGIAELRRRLREGVWEYHDAATGYWDADGRECHRQDLGEGTAERWPVFFADRGGPTLRYPRDQLLRLGLPAAELLDRPIRGHAEETYVVADATNLNSIPALWLELSPGRVVEVPVALFASRRQSLADLDWAQMHGGDQVTVRRRRNEQTGHVTLELRDWTPGLRGAWHGSPAVVLPVTEADPGAGALRLGAGDHTRWYPAEPSLLERYPVGSRVRLTGGNRLSTGQVRVDDTVLLLARDGGWGLAGFDDTVVTLAEDGTTTWPGARWLRELLADPAAGADLVAALGGALPVTVDELNRDGDRLRVTVSRRNQPSSRWRRRIVRSQVVTSVRGLLILRSGHALFQVPADRAIPGLDSAAVAAAATALRDRGTVLWWHHEEDELRPGASAATSRAEHAVRVELPIEVNGQFLGLVGRDAETGALGWLPSRLASWIGASDPRLPGLLAGPGPIPMVRERQQFSIVDRPAAAREHRLTEVGSVLSVVVVALPTEDHPAYLVRTAYTGVLLTLTAPPGHELGDRMRAEVTAVRGGRFPKVAAVPVGSRTAELDLPRPIAERLAQIHAGPLDAGWDQPFRDYRDAAGAAACPPDPNAAVVWSAEHGADPELLAQWVAAGGREVLAGRGEHHLAPLLAACLVAAELGESDTRRAGLAVLIAHQIGRRAIRSLHVEPLVRDWITRPERQTDAGSWEQIKRLGLAPEMAPDRLATVVQRCQAILARPVLRGSEDLRAPVAHALLVAAGSPARVDRFYNRQSWEPDAPLLAELAALGRGLTPPAGRPVAQAALLPAQLRILTRIRREVVGLALPLILLPTLSAPPPQWQTLLDADSR